MPKPRANISAAEEAIISKGGEPGSANAPIAAQPAPAPAPDSDDGVWRPVTLRFKPRVWSVVQAAVKAHAETHGKTTVNAWVAAACIEKAERDK
jgi:hypothetical protein